MFNKKYIYNIIISVLFKININLQHYNYIFEFFSKIFSDLLIEYVGLWYYLQYGMFRIRWNVENSWLITVEEPLKPDGSTAFTGICGNMDGNPQSKYILKH